MTSTFYIIDIICIICIICIIIDVRRVGVQCTKQLTGQFVTSILYYIVCQKAYNVIDLKGVLGYNYNIMQVTQEDSDKIIRKNNGGKFFGR